MNEKTFDRYKVLCDIIETDAKDENRPDIKAMMNEVVTEMREQMKRMLRTQE